MNAGHSRRGGWGGQFLRKRDVDPKPGRKVSFQRFEFALRHCMSRREKKNE